MHIKRFVGPDMRDAMRQIRAELGDDAVILSNEPVAEGVEVIAATDYDGQILEETTSRELTEPKRDERPGSAGLELYRENAEVTAPESVHRDPSPAATGHLEYQLAHVKTLLESQLASLAWNDMNRTKPIHARVVRQLSALGIDPEICAEIADQMPNLKAPSEAWRVPLKLFAERIPLVTADVDRTNRVIAVIGPTGVGKTTTIAKIAARFALRHRPKELALVSTDTFRIGAREQLFTFARILGVPMHTAESAVELRQLLDSLEDRKLVLIDTAGMSQRDMRLANQLSTLRVHGHDIATLLAVSAACDRKALEEVIQGFAPAKPKGLIVTKLDEATSLGPILSAAIRNQLPLAYLADGQRVPEDLHAARGKRFWLIQQAAMLARSHDRRTSEEELAMTFGELELAANG